MKSEADFTSIGVWCKDGDNNMYLLKNVVGHYTLNGTIEKIQELIPRYSVERLLIEDVGYQKALVQELTRKCQDVVVEGRKISTDKRSRLINVSNLFENGMVHFKSIDNDVVDQILYFPAAHDDMVDMTTLALGWYKERSGMEGIIIW